MTRIIAGSAKGRKLKVPKSGTRPTPDRVRESLFSSLSHRLQDWAGLRVIDLFAGSGALGLEALSRGADSAVLVDSARLAARICRDNISVTGLPAKIVESDVHRWLATTAATQFDLAFLDPPYELDDSSLETVLDDLVGRGWLADGAIVVVERSTRSEPTKWPAGFDVLKPRRFGDTELREAIWYVRAQT